MNSVILVYKTDAWHSYSSRDIIGIATDGEQAISICQQKANKENEMIDEDQLFNLRSLLQTQGYEGEGEFQLEMVATNELL